MNAPHVFHNPIARFAWLNIVVVLVTCTCDVSYSIAQQNSSTPQLMGAASCATSTCHGGVAGRGPVWNSSLSAFNARDPHLHAGAVLELPLSKQIVSLLEPGADFSDVLKRRCVSCHATVSTERTTSSEPITRSVILAGVSCESCHGGAANWLEPHVQVSWNDASRADPTMGMRDTKDWLRLTETCIRCHVGSRSEDGLVRDMNHDMIAAGHPALRFDMVTHFLRLPKHWDDQQQIDSEKASGEVQKNLLSKQSAARLVTLTGAAKLSLERSSAVGHDPTAVWPELADHDCFACHHQISIDPSQRTNARTRRPLWNPWYFIGLSKSPEELMLGSQQSLPLLQRLAVTGPEAAKRKLEQVASPMDVLRPLLTGPIAQKDWLGAARWYLDLTTATEACAEANVLSPAQAERLRSALREFAIGALAFSNHQESTGQSPQGFQWQVIESERARLLQKIRQP